jgi:hypothetical protein
MLKPETNLNPKKSGPTYLYLFVTLLKKRAYILLPLKSRRFALRQKIHPAFFGAQYVECSNDEIQFMDS